MQEYVKGISASGMQSNHGFDGQANACWRHEMSTKELESICSAGFLISVIHGRYFLKPKAPFHFFYLSSSGYIPA